MKTDPFALTLCALLGCASYVPPGEIPGDHPAEREPSGPARAGWELLDQTPAARRDHLAVYDSLRHRMLVFGGSVGTDTWAYTLDGEGAGRWTALRTEGEAPAALSSGAVYDPEHDRLVVLSPGSPMVVWELPLGETPRWRVVRPAGAAPSVSIGAGSPAVYDAEGGRLLTYPGASDGAWALRLRGEPAWVKLADNPTPTFLTYMHQVAYDTRRHQLIVIGRAWAPRASWALSLEGATPAWSRLEHPNVPQGFGQTVLYDPASDQLVVAGGERISPASWAQGFSLTASATDPPARAWGGLPYLPT